MTSSFNRRFRHWVVRVADWGKGKHTFYFACGTDFTIVLTVSKPRDYLSEYTPATCLACLDAGKPAGPVHILKEHQ